VSQQFPIEWDRSFPVTYEKPNLKNAQKLGHAIQLNGSGFGLFRMPSTKASSVTTTIFQEDSMVAAAINIAEEYKSKTIFSLSSKVEFRGASRLDRFKIEVISPSNARIHLASNFCRGYMHRNVSFVFSDFADSRVPISSCSQDGTYKPDGPTVSSSFGKDSYGLWQILVSSDEPVNQNTMIAASISVDFDERNVLIADIPALIIDWTSDSLAQTLCMAE
jgi:hypothetical protein